MKPRPHEAITPPDPWVIDDIKRREEEARQREEQRSRLEINIETPSRHEMGDTPKKDTPPKPSDRGVAEIDFSIN